MNSGDLRSYMLVFQFLTGCFSILSISMTSIFPSLVQNVPDEGDEHEYKKNPSRELQVLLGLVLAQRWDSGEKCLALGAGLSQHQKEGSNKGKVPEQELHVPKDTVGYRLKNCEKKETI